MSQLLLRLPDIFSQSCLIGSSLRAQVTKLEFSSRNHSQILDFTMSEEVFHLLR
jgi:hypothetical protein